MRWQFVIAFPAQVKTFACTPMVEDHERVGIIGIVYRLRDVISPAVTFATIADITRKRMLRGRHQPTFVVHIEHILRGYQTQGMRILRSRIAPVLYPIAYGFNAVMRFAGFAPFVMPP